MEKRNEIRRKTVHLCLAIIPVLYFFFSRYVMLSLTGVLLFVAILVEGLRIFNSKFAVVFNQKLGNLLRAHEKRGLTGATYLFISSFFMILLFQQNIAICVLFILIISDGLGALVGKLWGKHRLYGFKTVEGSIVFLVSAVLIVLFVFRRPLWIGWVGLITAFCVEVLIQKIDDNFTIPLFAGGVMQILFMLTQQGVYQPYFTLH